MDLITIACVNVGSKYPRHYVDILRRSVKHHLTKEHRFVCLTDNARHYPEIDTVDITSLNLPRWWSKMALFCPEIRGAGRVLYLDLDMVVCGDLAPLLEVENEFAICENFTRLGGNSIWPCLYGSCAMVFQNGWGLNIWNQFWNDRHALMDECAATGDQMAIQMLHPHAALLQPLLPANFFLHYRDLGPEQPEGTSVVVFGGRRNPDNCDIEWVRSHWH